MNLVIEAPDEFHGGIRQTFGERFELKFDFGLLVLVVNSCYKDDFSNCPDLDAELAELNEVSQLVVTANIWVFNGQFLRASQVIAK